MRKIILLLFIVVLNESFAQNHQVEEPVKNFDKLWNVFNDRYANFALKNIEWDAIYTKYRPLINKHTSNDSLFKVCSQMLLELKDGHVNLIQYGKKGEILARADDGSPSAFLRDFPLSKSQEPNIFQLLETTDKTLRQSGFSNFVHSRKGTIEYCSSDKYGYLRILSMGSLSLREYKKHVDNAISTFDKLQGVIIDVRFNGGGDDKVSLAIASRFADKKRIGHYKKERKKGTAEYTNLKTIYIEPDGTKQFTGPLVLLTSDLTASAAEVFTMVIKELPGVTILGDHTNGIFSDMFDFKLPNGWLVTLSHQQYFSSKMDNYEGKGVEPDINLLNKPNDISNGVDPLIASGIELIKQKTSINDGD